MIAVWANIEMFFGLSRKIRDIVRTGGIDLIAIIVVI
jgi:hypothetical protein